MQKTRKGNWTQIGIIAAAICFCLGVTYALIGAKPPQLHFVTSDRHLYTGISPQSAQLFDSEKVKAPPLVPKYSETDSGGDGVIKSGAPLLP